MNNILLEGINPSEIVKIANEILKPNCEVIWLINEHIHEDGYDFARELTIEKYNSIWVVDDALSGGRQEAVWNHYTEKFDSLFEAIVYALGLRGEA